MSQAVNVARTSDVFGGVPLANRNLVVDGAFDQWVPGLGTLTAGGGYNASPMYLNACGTGGAGTFGWTAMQLTAPSYSESNPRYAFVHTQTVASTGTLAARTLPFLIHRIEGVQTANARSLTLSVHLWVSSGSITIPGLVLSQSFGTGGSPSAPVIFDKAVNWVVTTTPKKFSVRVDVPSIVGKTFGTAANDSLSVGLWLPPGVTFTLVGGELQAELCNPNTSSDINGNGGAPTAFEYRGLGPELARSQRFYEVGTWRLLFNASQTNYWGSGTSTYKVTKRVVPAMSIVTTSNSNGTYQSASTYADLVTVAATANAPTGAVDMTGTFTADARL